MNGIGRALCVLVVCAAGASTAQGQDGDVRHLVLGDGDTIAVRSAGRGPAVVMVPGLLGGAFTFRHVATALVASGHRVVIVEPLGMGASARPQHANYTLEAQSLRVLAAMDSLGVTNAALVCHSVGGSICYRLALRAPARVAGIVSINGGPDEEAATSGLRRALKFAPLIRILGSGSMRGRLRDGLIESSADAAWVTDDVVAAYTAPYADLGLALRGLRGMASSEEIYPLAPRLEELGVPVLLLVGTGADDPMMTPEVLALLTETVPHLRVEKVSGAGQYIQEENPAAVVDAVHEVRELAADRDS